MLQSGIQVDKAVPFSKYLKIVISKYVDDHQHMTEVRPWLINL